MSLLLDALKKAEQAKREKAAAEVAAGAGPTGGPAPRPAAGGGGELQLEPLPEDRMRQAEGADRHREAAPQEPPEPAAEEEPGASSTLRLHLDEARRVAEEEGLDLEEFQRRLAEAAPPMGDTGSLGAVDVRETTSSGGQTLPSLKNVQAALRDFYGEPGARESEAASTLTVARPAAARPPPAAEALATTQASTQDARRAARNVFDAKRRPVRTARGPWGLLGVTAVLVAVLSVGGYYAAMTFTTVQPSSLAISRQPVSRPPALPPESGPPAGTPAPAPAASAPTTVAQAPSAPAVAVPSTAAGTPAPAAPAAPGPGVAAQAPAPQAPALPARTPTEEEAYRLATSAPATRRPPAETAVQAVAQATPPTLPAVRAPAPAAERASGPAEPASGALFPEPPGPAASAPRSAPVRVAARAAPDPTYTNLTRAYNAYQAGSYSEARRLYQQVLAREPTNRDALLGLGAVNAAEGRTDQARAAYQRALILNPRDEVAAAGMMSLRSGGAPQDEARLRQLVQQQPGASHLRFALGNTYAAQGRWSEAQQAYFDAFRGDSRNADYAFNLAVSLDHLAQARSALDYYRRALALGGGRFDADAARERIRVLEESGSGS